MKYTPPTSASSAKARSGRVQVFMYWLSWTGGSRGKQPVANFANRTSPPGKRGGEGRGGARIRVRIGHGDAEARRGENGSVGGVVTHAGALGKRYTAPLREFAERRELV